MQSRRREQGFTLIELLVVVLIIAILAAIAIPAFLRQREKGWQAQVQAALKDAATTLETYATGNGGVFTGVDGADSDTPAGPEYQILVTNGYNKAAAVRIRVALDDSDNKYCITANHTLLTGDWEQATYNSDEGAPRPTNLDTCS